MPLCYKISLGPNYLAVYSTAEFVHVVLNCSMLPYIVMLLYVELLLL